jgi:hypothetical protein
VVVWCRYNCTDNGADSWGRRRVNCEVDIVAWIAPTTGGNASHGWVGPIRLLDSSNRPTVTPSDPDTKRWANITEFEDPTVWLDNRGNYHVITHAYVPVDAIAPYRYADVVSAHGFSPNGLDWTWSATPPYTRWVNHTGIGQAVSYGTMERPFLLTEDLGDGPVPTA